MVSNEEVSRGQMPLHSHQALLLVIIPRNRKQPAPANRGVLPTDASPKFGTQLRDVTLRSSDTSCRYFMLQIFLYDPDLQSTYFVQCVRP
jgi:hypothetical protein